MTTIACNNGIMAADGYETTEEGTIVGYRTVKLFRLSDGSIVGGAGRSSNVLKFVDWLDDPKSEKPVAEGLSALRMYPNGEVVVYDEDLSPTPAETPCAVGSGSDFALIAMDLNLSPADAVKAAIGRDVGSGGLVTEMSCAPGKAKRRT